jgi:hypothetical protein
LARPVWRDALSECQENGFVFLRFFLSLILPLFALKTLQTAKYRVRLYKKWKKYLCFSVEKYNFAAS